MASPREASEGAGGQRARSECTAAHSPPPPTAASAAWLRHAKRAGARGAKGREAGARPLTLHGPPPQRAQRGFATRSERGRGGPKGAKRVHGRSLSTAPHRSERSVASPREASGGAGGQRARSARRPPTRLRRERDSNPRYLSVHTISNRAPSATRTPLQVFYSVRFKSVAIAWPPIWCRTRPGVERVEVGRALPGQPHRGRSQEPLGGSCVVEERVGVEPTLDLRPNLISNQALSATQPPLRPLLVIGTLGGSRAPRDGLARAKLVLPRRVKRAGSLREAGRSFNRRDG